MRRKGYFRTKIWHCHSLRRPQFPIRQNVFPLGLPSVFSTIYSIFLLLRRMTLRPWPLTLWPWECFSTARLMSDPHTNFYDPTTIGYWVTITEYLLTFPSFETATAHAPCHVTQCKYVICFKSPATHWAQFREIVLHACQLLIHYFWPFWR